MAETKMGDVKSNAFASSTRRDPGKSPPAAPQELPIIDHAPQPAGTAIDNTGAVQSGNNPGAADHLN